MDGYVTSGLHDPVKCATVNNQVFNHGEGPRPQGFYINGISIFEMPHMELADSRLFLRPMGNPVDDLRAHAADSLTAVMVKGYRLFAASDQAFIHNVEHL